MERDHIESGEDEAKNDVCDEIPSLEVVRLRKPVRPLRMKRVVSIDTALARRAMQNEDNNELLKKRWSSYDRKDYDLEAPPPAPLVVEDPPSSDNASDLEDLKHYHDPTLLDGGALKQLSSSTPAMTAQARSPEPPSPKAISKEDKLPTTSKARQKKFHRHFPAVDIEEKVLNYYSCALIGDILLQGHLYITKNYFAFYSNVFGYVTKLLIPLLSVEKITKEKTARIIPNAVGIATTEDKHVFGSLMSRDNTYRLMTKVWDAARNNAQTVEAELLAVNAPSECSDSTKSSESDTEFMVADSSSGMMDVDSSTRMRRLPSLWPPLNTGHSSKAASDAEGKSKGNSHKVWCNYSSVINLPAQTIVLYASTLLLLLLFFSAGVLLYRIGQVQQKYILALQDNQVMSSTEDVYGELLQWQAQLHSKSAGAVHNFLDTNLDQIAKVRQSLEALSTLLMVSSNTNNNSANQNTPNDHIHPPDAS